MTCNAKGRSVRQGVSLGGSQHFNNTHSSTPSACLVQHTTAHPRHRLAPHFCSQHAALPNPLAWSSVKSPLHHCLPTQTLLLAIHNFSLYCDTPLLSVLTDHHLQHTSLLLTGPLHNHLFFVGALHNEFVINLHHSGLLHPDSCYRTCSSQTHIAESLHSLAHQS